jgi:D-glycero-alpha-D-manno-heptose-7-phosphate kinase
VFSEFGGFIMIIVQSPLRVSFFGGGTDFPSFYLEEGGCVLSSTIDKYIFITVKNRFDHYLRVGYTKTELVENLEDIKHELIREALRKTGILQGIEITTMGDIPSAGSGLGSSSSVTVGTLQALYTYLGEIVPARRLAREACDIEIEILGKPVGVQDQYIAAYGGLRFIEFSRDGEISVESLDITRETQRKLSESLVLFYTGLTRSSGDILGEQKDKISGHKRILGEIRNLAISARKDLEAGSVDEIGHMLHYSWNLKKKLASRISNREIDSMYNAGREAGAHGGKITGAGGGGFMLFFCPPENQGRLRDALNAYQEVPFRLELDGAKVIFNYQRSSAGVPEFGVAPRHMSQSGPSKLAPDSPKKKAPIVRRGPAKPETLKQYVDVVHGLLDKLPSDAINQVVQVLQAARFEHRKVFIFGNGGSAATATHFVCDLAKNTRRNGAPHFRAVGLTDNMAEFSAYANDEGYENVFLLPIMNLLESGDVAIGISASGNSENVIRAIKYAKERGSTTIGFTGFNGGALAPLVDINLHVDCSSYEQVEDLHLIFEHMIVKALKDLDLTPPQVEQDRKKDLAQLSLTEDRSYVEKNAEEIQAAHPMTTHPSALRLLYEINHAAITKRNIIHALESIFRVALDYVGGVSGSVLYFNDEGDLEGGFMAYQGQITKHLKEEMQDTYERGLASWVVERREATLVQSTLDDRRWLQKEWELEEQRSRSAISVPLYTNGHLVAVLTLVRGNANEYTEADLAMLSVIPFTIAMNSDILM